MIGKYDEHKDQVTLKLDRAEAYHLWAVLSHVGGSGPIRDTVQKIHDFIDAKVVGQRGAVTFTEHFTQKGFSTLYVASHLDREKLSDPHWWNSWAKAADEQFLKDYTVEVDLEGLMGGV